MEDDYRKYLCWNSLGVIVGMVVLFCTKSATLTMVGLALGLVLNFIICFIKYGGKVLAIENGKIWFGTDANKKWIYDMQECSFKPFLSRTFFAGIIPFEEYSLFVFRNNIRIKQELNFLTKKQFGQFISNLEMEVTEDVKKFLEEEYGEIVVREAICTFS